jgi:hypothetical protein
MSDEILDKQQDSSIYYAEDNLIISICIWKTAPCRSFDHSMKTSTLPAETTRSEHNNGLLISHTRKSPSYTKRKRIVIAFGQL